MSSQFAHRAARSFKTCHKGSRVCNALSASRQSRHHDLQVAYISSTAPLKATTTSYAKPTTTSTAKSTTASIVKPSTSTSTTATPAKAPVTASSTSAPKPISDPETRSLTEGLSDEPLVLGEDERQVDWSRSFHGLSASPFSKEAADHLLQPVDMDDIEIKPDGIIYLPEIKYRRILTKAFGPGGWGLAPRGETIVTPKSVTREYGLVVGGRLVSIARGEQQYFDPEGIPTATEGCKSNALMRCCKDLGIASELWDPRFIRKFMSSHAKEIWVEHQVNKRRRKHYMRKDDVVRYPFKEVKVTGASGAFS